MARTYLVQTIGRGFTRRGFRHCGFTLVEVVVSLFIVSLAVAVAVELGLDLGQVARALEDVRLPGGRCEVQRHGDLTILNDTYNANPESLTASLQTAAALRGQRPFVPTDGWIRNARRCPGGEGLPGERCRVGGRRNPTPRPP